MEKIKDGERIVFDTWRMMNPDLSSELETMGHEGLTFKDFAGVETTNERISMVTDLIKRHQEARKQDNQKEIKKTVSDLKKLLEIVVVELYGR